MYLQFINLLYSALKIYHWYHLLCGLVSLSVSFRTVFQTFNQHVGNVVTKSNV